MTIRAAIIAAVALVIGLASFDDARPADPFGGRTVAVLQGPLVDAWRTVGGELLGDHALLGACVDSVSDDCAPARALWAIIAEAKGYDGIALIGHLNRAINLAIKPVTPSAWLGGLDAINSDGDCKAYATAKYFALREAGIAPDHVRILIVHERGHGEDHMVDAVYQDGSWLILDNRTLLLIRDIDEPNYMPLFVLDDDGVRRYLPPAGVS